MSIEIVKSFFAEVSRSPELQEELKSVSSETRNQAIHDMAQIGVKHGFVFTVDELEESLQSTEAQQERLSDTELREVAGGAPEVNFILGLIPTLAK